MLVMCSASSVYGARGCVAYWNGLNEILRLEYKNMAYFLVVSINFQ